MSDTDGTRPVQAGAWIELSRGALARNLAIFRRISAAGARAPRLGAVLKANAYGHGLREILPIVHPLVDLLYFIAPGDALGVRVYEARHGLGPRRVVVIGAVTPDEARELAQAGVEAVVGDGGWRALARELARPPAQRLRIHVHLDSGLGREGVLPEDVPAVFEGIAHDDSLEVVGAMSHFSNTEDVTEQTYAREQLARFDAGLRALQAVLGPRELERHFAASAAALVLPESRLDAIRVGIAAYGLWPSGSTRLSARIVLGEVPELRPVLAWRVRSQTVKTLPAGHFVGYGCTFRCARETRIAVLPVGYWDGYPRVLGGRAHVLVSGRRCPVLGRVMMNHIVADVTGVPDVEDSVVATLLGSDGAEAVSADQLAQWADTIHYEIVARLGAHLTRRVIG